MVVLFSQIQKSGCNKYQHFKKTCYIGSVFAPHPTNDTSCHPCSSLCSLVKGTGVHFHIDYFQESSTSLICTFLHIKINQQCFILCPESWKGGVSGGSYLGDLKYLEEMVSKLYILAIKVFWWLGESPENSNTNNIFLIFSPAESLNFSWKTYLNSLKSLSYLFFLEGTLTWILWSLLILLFFLNEKTNDKKKWNKSENLWKFNRLYFFPPISYLLWISFSSTH